MNLKNRLNTIAKYLGKQGLYKEAAQIQKIAMMGIPDAVMMGGMLGAMPAALLARNLSIWYDSPAGKKWILEWKKKFGLTDEEGEAIAEQKIKEYQEIYEKFQQGKQSSMDESIHPDVTRGLGLFEIGKSSSRKNTFSKLAMKNEEAAVELEKHLNDILKEMASNLGYEE